MKLAHAAASAAFLLASLSPLHAQSGEYLYGGYEDLGGGLPGYQSQVPELFGTGTCTAGTMNQLVISGAIPSSGLSMVTGYIMKPEPLLGGILWPNPDIVIPMSTDASGNAQLEFTWPAFTPGMPLFFQAAVYDPSAVEGMAFSNLLRGETAGWGLYVDDPFIVTYPVVQIGSTDTYVGLPQATVTFENEEEGVYESAKSDMQGFAAFPNLPVATGLSSDPLDYPGTKVKTWVTASATVPGYVPQRKQLWFTESTSRWGFWMVPLSSGQVTPMVSAAAGGTFVLQGIGTLHVPADAMTQDAKIRVVVIPWRARDPHRIPTELRYQVWIGAEDAQGNQLSGVLPTSHAAGMTLEVTLSESSDLLNATQVSTTSYSYSDDGTKLDETSGLTFTNLVITPAVTAGQNLIGATYAAVASVACGCGPWKVRTKEISRRYVPGGVMAVDCGAFGGPTTQAEVQAKEEITSGWSKGAEVGGKLKWGGSLIFAACEAELSAKFDATISGSTVTTTHKAAIKIAKNGDRFREHIPNSNCIDGCLVMGLEYVTYLVYVVRECEQTGPACYERLDVGTIEVCKGLVDWLSTPTWNTGCAANCAQQGTISPRIKVVNTQKPLAAR
jgi:hypothetical protein